MSVITPAPLELSQISVYPIKSSKGLALSHAQVELRGLAFDRRFVVIDSIGRAITGRTHAILTQLRVAITAQGLALTAPGMPPLAIQYQAFSDNYVTTKIKIATVEGQHCHDSYDQWFSQLLAMPCRLVYFGEKSYRLAKNCTDAEVGFADGYPLLLIGEASLADLNSRCVRTHDMAQFRPNLVVKNSVAYDEDSWARIRIGSVEFRVEAPCFRCVFTTVNTKTGLRDPDGEPLSVLKGYRSDEANKINFGQNLIPLNVGSISLDDEIEILAYR